MSRCSQVEFVSGLAASTAICRSASELSLSAMPPRRNGKHSYMSPLVHIMLMDREGKAFNIAGGAGSRQVRFEACRVCGNMIAKEALAKHTKECIQMVFLQSSERPNDIVHAIKSSGADFGTCSIALVSLPHHAGAACLLHLARAGPPKALVHLQAVLSEGTQYWLKRSRVEHQGHLFCWGTTRFGMATAGFEALKPMVDELLQILKDDGFPMTPKLDWAWPLPGLDFNAYFAKQSYQPRKASADTYHDPPPAVAWLLGCDSCRATCQTCQQRGCRYCDYCPLHVDVGDASPTLLYQWQPPDTPAHHRAFFCCNGFAYSIVGGFSMIFHGAIQEHGVWGPTGCPEQYQWLGCAFVRKTSNDFERTQS